MTQTRGLLETSRGTWEVVIGLEVHAQVSSQSKLFSSAATSFAAEPNSKVSPVDAGMPGMLPVLNQFCVEQAIKTGLGLNAHINLVSRFDRKNYFYADLPSGYQISQFYTPIVGEGYLDIELENGTTERIRIERIHLEQDAGKSIHDVNPTKSCIDLNRAGTALMEIVTKPDLRSAEEVMAFVRKLRLLLRYLGTSDGNMEEGSLRADVNVSIHRPHEPYGTRAEIKNVNSIRFIGQAIDYEVARQIEIIESGGKVIQETRQYDPNRGETRSMRAKEDAQDYRYFPDPDLLPVKLTQEYVNKIKDSLPELPDHKKHRFMSEYGLSSYDASLLVGDLETPAYFETALFATQGWKEKKDFSIAKLVANWLLGELFAALNRENKELKEAPVSASALAQLIDLIYSDVISGKIAKDVFAEMWGSHESAKAIVESKGLLQISDSGAIINVIDKILAANPEKVADYKSGKDKLFGFFVGQVMKAMGGKANPKLLNDLLQQKLS
jgi:aspartyl-tRNA(Asn)/glutamyl-tRNA(Gln) amidotransferase subunit B